MLSLLLSNGFFLFTFPDLQFEMDQGMTSGGPWREGVNCEEINANCFREETSAGDRGVGGGSHGIRCHWLESLDQVQVKGVILVLETPEMSEDSSVSSSAW